MDFNQARSLAVDFAVELTQRLSDAIESWVWITNTTGDQFAVLRRTGQTPTWGDVEYAHFAVRRLCDSEGADLNKWVVVEYDEGTISRVWIGPNEVLDLSVF